jgi:hypothetical protein
MSVGLETMLDYQRFLLEECGLKIDGKTYRIEIESRRDMKCFLAKLADFSRVRICANDMQPVGLSTVEWYGERAVVWPVAQPREKVSAWPNSGRYQEANPNFSFTMVPELLEIVVDSDPRMSRAVLFGSRLAHDVPRKNEHGYECPEIAFYSQNVKASRQKKALIVPDLPLAKRLERLAPVFTGRYPHMALCGYSFKMRDGYALVQMDFVTDVRAHLEKKDKFVADWMNANMPLPAYIHSMEGKDSSGRAVLKYRILIELPE